MSVHPAPSEGELRPVADALAAASRLLVLTGSGISAASGVPTYRQSGSGWTDPALERMSHASRYGNKLPQLWQFWGQLRALTAAADPNTAHGALAVLQRRAAATGGSVTVVTQNVDGLHQRAGSTGVLELHGSIHATRCLRRSCGTVTCPDERVPEPGAALGCAACGRPARPHVVLFGEQPPAAVWRAARQQAETAQLCLVVGTSGQVWPAAGLVASAKRAGARCVLVNADRWPQDESAVFDDVLLGPAEQLLPALLAS